MSLTPADTDQSFIERGDAILKELIAAKAPNESTEILPVLQENWTALRTRKRTNLTLPATQLL